MSIDWKRLSIGLIASIIIVCFAGMILSVMNVVQVDNGWCSTFSNIPNEKLDAISDCLSENNIELTIVSGIGDSNSILYPLWIWIIIGICVIIGCTLIFYVGSSLIKKK
jgi:hypothetical protein